MSIAIENHIPSETPLAAEDLGADPPGSTYLDRDGDLWLRIAKEGLLLCTTFVGHSPVTAAPYGLRRVRVRLVIEGWL